MVAYKKKNPDNNQIKGNDYFKEVYKSKKGNRTLARPNQKAIMIIFIFMYLIMGEWSHIWDLETVSLVGRARYIVKFHRGTPRVPMEHSR